MRFRVGATSDVGRVRTNNEDAYLVAPPLFVVADGMGGMEAGEVASGLAIDTLRGMEPVADVDAVLADWVRRANQAIFSRAEDQPELAGMGTTLTAMVVDGDEVRVAHVGDSRAYLLRDGELQQLTEDHTRVHRLVKEGMITEAEAAVHPERNVLSRALGVGADVTVDEFVVHPRAGDRFLLCSDGLYGMVHEDAIREALASTPDPQEAADRLVGEANAGGGVDNITAIVLDVDAEDGDGGTERLATAVTATLPGAETQTLPTRTRGAPRGLLLGVPIGTVVVAVVVAVLLLTRGASPAVPVDATSSARGGTGAPSAIRATPSTPSQVTPSGQPVRTSPGGPVQSFADGLTTRVAGGQGFVRSLRQAIDALRRGAAPQNPGGLVLQGQSILQGIRGVGLPAGLKPGVSANLTAAKSSFVSEFSIYERLAQRVRASAKLPPILRRRFPLEADPQMARARTLQARGYACLHAAGVRIEAPSS